MLAGIQCSDKFNEIMAAAALSDGQFVVQKYIGEIAELLMIIIYYFLAKAPLMKICDEDVRSKLLLRTKL